MNAMNQLLLSASIISLIIIIGIIMLRLADTYKNNNNSSKYNRKCITYTNGYRSAMRSLIHSNKPQEYSDTIPYHNLHTNYDKGRRDAFEDYCELILK